MEGARVSYTAGHYEMRPPATRVLFLASDVRSASCRFRVRQCLPYLQRAGIRADLIDLHAPLSQRWRSLRSASGYDVTCVHRAFLNPIEYRWLRQRAKRYVFDFDDAILFRDSASGRFESWQRRARFRRMVSGADRVIAGNAYLGSLAARYNQHVTVIPTAIDLQPYPQRAPERPAEPIVGWIGTHVNLIRNGWPRYGRAEVRGGAYVRRADRGADRLTTAPIRTAGRCCLAL
jgi:hypothetical protein